VLVRAPGVEESRHVPPFEEVHRCASAHLRHRLRFTGYDGIDIVRICRIDMEPSTVVDVESGLL
jgi:hypothetical protein